MAGLFRCMHKNKNKNKDNDKSSNKSSDKSTKASSTKTPHTNTNTNATKNRVPQDDESQLQEEYDSFTPNSNLNPKHNLDHHNHDQQKQQQQQSLNGSNTNWNNNPIDGLGEETKFHQDDVQSRLTYDESQAMMNGKKSINYYIPPPAREAAFHGPPRFDWIDIETNAVTKIQSIYRRNKTMSALEAKGVSTSAIRNRKRRRKAVQKSKASSSTGRSRVAQSQDVPSFFSCCAVGLAFGEATEDDEEAYREFQRKQYEERQEQQEMHETAMRTQYLRAHGGGKVVEAVEVVE